MLPHIDVLVVRMWPGPVFAGSPQPLEVQTWLREFSSEHAFRVCAFHPDADGVLGSGAVPSTATTSGTMTKLFVHHDGRRGEVLLMRPLLAAIAAHGTDVVVGCCRGDGDLLQGLGSRVTIREGLLANTPWGAPAELSYLCPRDLPKISVWAGGNDPIPTNQWADLVASFTTSCRALGLVVPIGDTAEVPDLDFAGTVSLPTPVVARAVYVDTQRTMEGCCGFDFDLARLGRALPDHQLLLTSPEAAARLRGRDVLDVSGWTWAQRSRASEACEILIGRTLDPFVLTMTAANRWKPKALCGFDARVVAPFWDYPGNPAELLATMDDLIDFVVANHAVETGR